MSCAASLLDIRALFFVVVCNSKPLLAGMTDVTCERAPLFGSVSCSGCKVDEAVQQVLSRFERILSGGNSLRLAKIA